jgi:ferredoxin
MSRHIKKVAKRLGMDVVGVGKSHPSFMYGGRSSDRSGTGDQAIDSAEALAREYPYFIVGSPAWDYDLLQAHRHHIGDIAYEVSSQRTAMVLTALEGYIHELGYKTLRGAMNGQAAAIASGVGELGRNGLVITPEYGARVHLNDTILTDMPLEPGKPIDIAVNDFCAICRKCAETCPTNSITFEGKSVVNGVEKYKINWETCYKLRPYVIDHWSSCLTCVVVCPYTKPLAWWHKAAIFALRATPVPVRPLLVRSLKWADDKFWGVIPRKRVQWLGYDSGIKPGEKACTIEGCTASHENESHSFIPVGDIGYYAPLKENTNRFVKR